MRGLLVTLLFCITALAGCSGSSEKADTLAEGFKDLELAATATTGVIRGVVVDAAIRPIAGASVILLTNNKETNTSSSGLFGFSDLEPGPHFLQIRKTGYVSTQQSVEVVAGVANPAAVKVLLIHDPTSMPYYVQHRHAGFISCSAKTANLVSSASTCDASGALGYRARDDSAPWFFIDQPPLYYQSEMIWKATQTLGTELVTIQLACSQGSCAEVSTSGNANRICNVRGPSPLTCRVTPETGGGGGGVGLTEAKLGAERTGYRTSMYANCYPCVQNLGVGVVLEQKFDIFNHLFYGYLPPSDWTFFNTSKVPSPP